MRASEPLFGGRKQEILREALQRKTGEERAAFLKEACGGDAALLAEMEAALARQGAGTGLKGEGGDEPLPEGITELTATLPDQLAMTEGPGSVIGRYKLLEQIGEGGFGTVYVAEQREPVKRQVALKIIKLGMDTRQVVARFEAERQALALMDHPNIAKVFDGGATDTGRPFFVMELVKGIPLPQYCDQEKLSTSERLKLFIAVCQAIQHAHQKGIIHRDIKPSNILVTIQDGRPVPKVIDFGIAKATQQKLTEKTLHTMMEQFIGTPAYMSPEQAEMSGLDIDTRSDIYSLGVLLYELLVGKTPFDSKALLAAGVDEIRRTIRGKEPARPSTRLSAMGKEELTTATRQRGAEASQLMSLLRGDLDWIVMKCLEKDRTRRYDTANGLAMDIERHLNHEPVAARPPSLGYRLQKSFRRNKVVFTAAGIVFAALVLGMVMSGWQAIRAARAEARARTEAARAIEESSRAQAAEKLAVEKSKVAEQERNQAEANLYIADMLLAHRAWEESNVGLALELLNKHRPKAGVEDIRDWEWRYLWRLCQSDELFSLGQLEDRVAGIAFCPDGLRVVTAACIGNSGESGSVTIWDYRSRRRLTTLAEGGAMACLAVSPNGQMVAFGTNNSGVVVWNTQLGRVVASFPAEQGYLTRGLAFSPDSHTLAVGNNDGLIALWSMETRARKLTLFQPPYDGITSLAFSPDGRRLASSCWAYAPRLWDLASGQVIAEFTGHTRAVQTVAISPDDKTLVTAGWDSTIRVHDISKRSSIAVLTNHIGCVNQVAFSPDGNTLASAAIDHSIRLWDTGTWQERDTLRGHQDEVESLAFSPDGNRLITGCKNGEVKVWSTARKRRETNSFKVPDGTFLSVSVDGSAFLIGHTNGTVSLWSTIPLRQEVNHSISDPSGNAWWGSRCWAIGGKLWAYSTTNGWVKVRSCEDGSVIGRVQSGSGRSVRVALSAKGNLLACGHDSSAIRLWRTEGLQEVATLSRTSKDRVSFLLFSQDDGFVAAATKIGVVEVWGLRGGQHLTLGRHAELVDAAFMPDGESLVTAGMDATVRVWDLTSGREKCRGRTLNAFFEVAAAPNGRRLATRSDDFISVWDAATGREITRLTNKIAPYIPSHIKFLPDGNTLLNVTTEGLRVWRAPSWEEIAAAEESARGRMQ